VFQAKALASLRLTAPSPGEDRVQLLLQSAQRIERALGEHLPAIKIMLALGTGRAVILVHR
jgi:hypothetical protein